jgi:hypothetical protein
VVFLGVQGCVNEVEVALECEVVDVELQQSMSGRLAGVSLEENGESAARVISCDAQRKRLVQAAANRVAPRMLTSYQRWNGGIHRIGPKKPC